MATRNNHRRWMLLSGCALAAMPSFAAAQQAGPVASETTGGIEDIVVTARRTEERLQTTPVSVTAVGAAMIARAQIESARDLQRAAPNLNVSTGSPSVSGYAFISIRGQTQVNPGTASDPAVGIYIDGVYIPRPSQGLFDFADLARVEVLRGPQGTLFGRNTTGGALNIVTKQPTGNFEGSAQVSYGNYDAVEGSASLNVPLDGEALAARVVYSYSRHDGYGYNPLIDQTAFDQRGSHFVRGKLRWAPAGSDWNVTLSGDYNRQRDSGQAVALAGFNVTALAPLVGQLSAAFPALAPTLAPLADLTPILTPFLHRKDAWFRTYGSTGPLGERPMDILKAAGGSLTINGTIGSVGLQSITGYRYSRTDSVIDLDGTPLRLAQNHSGFGSKQFSQELQLTGEAGILKWIGGLYYSRETGDERSVFEALGVVGSSPLLNDGDVLNISKGVYGQAYVTLAEGLRLAAGLRWTWDTRKVVLHNLSVFDQPSTCNVAMPDGGRFPPCDQTEKAHFDYPAWTAGLDYQVTPEIFTYVKTSGAAMAGGWNLRFGSIPAFKPEKVRDVEIGIKAETLDRRLRANLSVFHAWQRDVQRNINIAVTPTSITQYVVNSGNARVKGIELELTAVPWTGMELTGGLGLLDGEYEKGSFTEPQFVNGALVTVDRSGEPLPQLAKLNATIGATQTLKTSFGTLDLHADYAYISSQTFNPLTAAPGLSAAERAVILQQNALSRIPGYGLVNARAALTLDEPAIQIAVFARNLFANKYVTRSFSDLYTGPLAAAVEFPGAPRTYGLSIGYRFGS